MEVIEAYKCKTCGKIHNRKENAYECEFNHSQIEYANCLLDEGYELGYINRKCGFKWELSAEQDKITKDNCFIMSHWQCCDKPAYKITSIDSKSLISLFGCGSWSGYYEGKINPEKLPKSYPKEDLFIDKRYGK